jgi:hypothetical protein
VEAIRQQEEGGQGGGGESRGKGVGGQRVGQYEGSISSSDYIQMWRIQENV